LALLDKNCIILSSNAIFLDNLSKKGEKMLSERQLIRNLSPKNNLTREAEEAIFVSFLEENQPRRQ
jgi:hypothetical protein